MINPKWKTYTCRVCGSPYDGAFINPKTITEQEAEQLDYKYLPDMCPICGAEQNEKVVQDERKD